MGSLREEQPNPSQMSQRCGIVLIISGFSHVGGNAMFSAVQTNHFTLPRQGLLFHFVIATSAAITTSTCMHIQMAFYFSFNSKSACSQLDHTGGIYRWDLKHLGMFLETFMEK